MQRTKPYTAQAGPASHSSFVRGHSGSYPILSTTNMIYLGSNCIYSCKLRTSRLLSKSGGKLNLLSPASSVSPPSGWRSRIWTFHSKSSEGAQEAKILPYIKSGTRYLPRYLLPKYSPELAANLEAPAPTTPIATKEVLRDWFGKRESTRAFLAKHIWAIPARLGVSFASCRAP